MIKDVHIYVKNCFLSTHILFKSPGVAVISGGEGSLTYRPLIATKRICPRGENKAQHTYF